MELLMVAFDGLVISQTSATAMIFIDGLMNNYSDHEFAG